MRASSADQQHDLDRQLVRLTAYAIGNRLVIVDAVKEIGSGLNGHRKNMPRRPGNAQGQVMLVEHRERLTRFGFEYVEAALAARNRRIMVIEPDEMKDDIVREMTEVLTSMCAGRYGKRSAPHRAEQALAAPQGGYEAPS